MKPGQYSNSLVFLCTNIETETNSMNLSYENITM